jgi:hypothetical protein
MARALHPLGPVALDQPPGRRRLLGLADPARVGTHSVASSPTRRCIRSSTYEHLRKAMGWLEKYQPSVFDAIEASANG